jgi:drug/metabolite transporter (DMT)-like permease
VTSHLAAGISIAVLSAIFYNTGIVIEKLAARSLPEVHLRRGFHMVVTLFRAPLWTLGFVLLLFGLGSQVIALSLAPISVVQTVSACGIAYLLLLSHLVLQDDLGRTEWLGIGAVALSLVLLGLSVRLHADVAASGGNIEELCLAALPAAAIAIGCFIAANRVSLSTTGGQHLSAPLFGVASGLLYGIAALGVKMVSTVVERDGVAGSVPRAFTSPGLYIVMVASGFGFLVFQTALQRCRASIIAPVSNVVASAYFIAVGTAIFHERLPTGISLVLRVAAFASICAALLALTIKGEVEALDSPDADAIDAVGRQRHQERSKMSLQRSSIAPTVSEDLS